jgi:hypothetical protein
MKDCVYPPLFSFHGSHTSIELVAMGMKFDVGHQSISSPSTKFAWHLSLSLSIHIYIYIYIYNVCVCVLYKGPHGLGLNYECSPGQVCLETIGSLMVHGTRLENSEVMDNNLPLGEIFSQFEIVVIILLIFFVLDARGEESDSRTSSGLLTVK